MSCAVRPFRPIPIVGPFCPFCGGLLTLLHFDVYPPPELIYGCGGDCGTKWRHTALAGGGWTITRIEEEA